MAAAGRLGRAARLAIRFCSGMERKSKTLRAARGKLAGAPEGGAG